MSFVSDIMADRDTGLLLWNMHGNADTTPDDICHSLQMIHYFFEPMHGACKGFLQTYGLSTEDIKNLDQTKRT